MKKIFLIIATIVISLVCAETTKAADDIAFDWQQIKVKPELASDKKVDVDARSAVVYDLDSSTVLSSKNPNNVQAIASITKLMTATVVAEDLKTSDVITTSYRAAAITGSKMHIQTNEQVKLSDIVHGLIISSANDGAAAVEDFYGQEKIVGLMNKKAQELGMKNTKYQDAVGLSENNVSNATDLFILSKHALNISLIAESAKSKTYTFTSVSGTTHTLNTTNRLLKNYPDIFGLKTGYTEEAGNCLIAAAQQDGHRILSVLLGSSDYDLRFSDSRKLLDWTFDSYKW